PEGLIPLDAPTQKRNYSGPSATSRKRLPESIVRKRRHSDAFGDDAEELSPTPSEAEEIERKRRQNTVAARKSRKRKFEYTQSLENKVQQLEGQITTWRTRAEMAREMLRNQ
ncbi:hypothetical protein B0H19DRAFT_879537, partial [Mycena capillaripes]